MRWAVSLQVSHRNLFEQSQPHSLTASPIALNEWAQAAEQARTEATACAANARRAAFSIDPRRVAERHRIARTRLHASRHQVVAPLSELQEAQVLLRACVLECGSLARLERPWRWWDLDRGARCVSERGVPRRDEHCERLPSIGAVERPRIEIDEALHAMAAVAVRRRVHPCLIVVMGMTKAGMIAIVRGQSGALEAEAAFESEEFKFELVTRSVVLRLRLHARLHAKLHADLVGYTAVRRCDRSQGDSSGSHRR